MQTRTSLTQLAYLSLGPWQEGALEWTGLIHHEESPPGSGDIAFEIYGVNRTAMIFGRHLATGGTEPFRIVAWPIAEGVRVVSVRDAGGGVKGTGANTLKGKDTKYIIGFVTSTRVKFSKVRMRRLPDEWTPERDPDLQNRKQAEKPRSPLKKRVGSENE